MGRRYAWTDSSFFCALHVQFDLRQRNPLRDRADGAMTRVVHCRPLWTRCRRGSWIRQEQKENDEIAVYPVIDLLPTLHIMSYTSPTGVIGLAANGVCATVDADGVVAHCTNHCTTFFQARSKEEGQSNVHRFPTLMVGCLLRDISSERLMRRSGRAIACLYQQNLGLSMRSRCREFFKVDLFADMEALQGCQASEPLMLM